MNAADRYVEFTRNYEQQMDGRTPTESRPSIARFRRFIIVVFLRPNHLPSFWSTTSRFFRNLASTGGASLPISELPMSCRGRIVDCREPA